MDLLDNDGFVEGVLRSAVILGPVVVVLLVLRRRHAAPLPIGGLAATGVSLLALAGADALPGRLALGVVLAGVGGLLGAVTSLPLAGRFVLVAPGVLIAVGSVDGRAGWMTAAAVAAGVTMGPAADNVDHWYRATGLGVAMLCVAVAGVFVTIPETGAIAPVLGAMVPVGLLAVPWPVAWLGPGGASAMVALLATLTLDGGWVRPGAIVGGLLAPGLLVVLAFLPRPPRAAVARPWPPLALRLAVLQVLVTLGVTRVAGLQESAVVAVLIAAVVLAGGAIVARLAITRASVVDRPRSGSS